MRTVLFAATLALSSMTMTGCGSNQVIQALDATVAATEVVLSVLSAGGNQTITVEVAAQVNTYLESVRHAADLAAVELASSDATADKVLKVTSYFSTATANFKALSPEAQVVAAVVDAAVRAFLATLTTNGGTAPAKIAVSSKDAAKLAGISARSRRTVSTTKH